MFADTLGFVEQKFSYLNFEKGKWSRSVQLPCYTYAALEDAATVNVLRIGMGNLVPFKAAKGLKVTPQRQAIRQCLISAIVGVSLIFPGPPMQGQGLSRPLRARRE